MRSRSTRLLASIAIAVAIFGQTSSPGQTSGDSLAVSAGTPFELKAGQTAALEKSTLLITFLQVVQDSRCPIGVQCIWAGEASIAIRVETPPAPAESRTLTIGRSDPATTYGGFTITLLDLQPRPREGVAIDPSDYRATLRIDPAPR